MKTWLQLATEQSKTFTLSQPLIIGETYTISMNSNEPFIISVGDVFVGETVDGSLEFIATNSGDVTITSYSDISMEFEIKLELGSQTEWSPAPEDGYGLDLPNGAYHIQISGGDSRLKILSPNTKLDIGNNRNNKVTVHPFNTLQINNNYGGSEYMEINETTTFNKTAIGNGTNFNAIQFWSLNPTANLDFIASDPSITNALSSFPAQSVTDAIDINPITMVTAYWDDESAFQVGTPDGSDIIIDNPWATQLSTDYVYSVLNGFKYKPISGKGVYLDPKYELGDYFTYGSQDQLVAKISWKFNGVAIANVDAPISTDSNFDDPYQTLKEQAFKRKVTLGDSYQGVSISRENGIQMLYSPDGTEENALGRYYADLEKGIAFQTRNSPNDDWSDWLYFDVTEQVFKLALYSTTQEIDGIMTDSGLLIEALSDSLKVEISERKQEGEDLKKEIKTAVEATEDKFEVRFTGVETNIKDINGELVDFGTYFRWDENGAMIGKLGSPVEFFQTNDMIGFRENGVVIAQWEKGEMTVDNLIAKISIVIGTHQVEKYDSPVAGTTTLVRRVNV